MKVLLISSYLPYPLFSGGQVRLYNLIKELSGKHEITLVCEKRSTQTDHDIAEVKKICKDVITVGRKAQWSFSNILKAGLSSHSFLATGHTLPALKRKIQELLDQKQFDVIHVETSYIMQNVPKTQVPIVLVEHNIEYLVYQRFMDKAPLFLRPLLAIDINKIRKEEEHFWKTAQKTVAVSVEDQQVMKQAGVTSSLVSNGVNTDQFSFKSFEKRQLAFEKERKILFLGDFAWIQNRDSVEFIVKEIWPLIKQQVRDIQRGELKLWIVARRIPESIRSLTNDQTVLFDEASSQLPTEKIFQEAAILLAPIRIGGGTSYKILESMASGTPVVTMQMSADALGAKDGSELLVGANAKELAEKALLLLDNEDMYKVIGKRGRELIEKKYTWKEIGRKLEGVYTQAVL